MLKVVCSCVTNKVDDEDKDDYDPANKGPNVKRSCTDVKCLVIFIIFCVGWVGVALYALVRGNPARLVHPTNSEGEICGHGKHVGKTNLLYFDLARCAGISAAGGGCPTPQVCVEECPRTYWTSAQGKSSGLELFCVPGTNMINSISQLVKEISCPVQHTSCQANLS